MWAGCVSIENHPTKTPEYVSIQVTQTPVLPKDVSANITDFSVIEYNSYCNNKYDFCIDYPSFLVPQGESLSKDGQKFIAKDSSFVMYAYRDFEDNVNPDISFTIQHAYKKCVDSYSKQKITYKKRGKDFFVVSGVKNKFVFYRKSFIKENQFFTLLLEYKVTLKDKYNSAVDKISKSFQ